MAGNRVDELEAKVRELQATVDGLTDELLETRERLHALEDETDEVDILEGRPTRTDTSEESTDRTATDDEESADEVNSAEANGEDNADSRSSDDIIVA